MLILSMSCFGSPRRVACLAAHLLTGVLLSAIPVLGPPAYARQQDTGFLNRSITLNGTVYHYEVYLPRSAAPTASTKPR
jgi:hypothetical protein